MALGFISIAAAFLLLTSSTGIGIIIGLVVATIMAVVYLIKPNALQDFLIDTLYGKTNVGAEKNGFKGLAQQQIALESIAKS
ncbi:hypothetical protein [Xanthomonas oryzae]|nr:hypothetical protein [Xanthomonas oryzae]